MTFPATKVALLGPNGAGKSTLLRLAAGLVEPSAGTVQRSGRSSYMPQEVRAMRGLAVREQVAYSAWLKGRSTAAANVDAVDALGRVGLLEQAGRPARQLSGGQVRRLGLAQALAGENDFLVLDEPMASLDPVQSREVASAVRAIDLPMIVATHHLVDLDRVFDDVVVVLDGQVIWCGPVHRFVRDGDGAVLDPYDAYARVIGRAGL